MPTGIRNRWKVGSWLVRDDESGFTEYVEDTVERWDGIIFRKRGNEDEISQHPQDFVRALDDPQPVSPIRPVALVTGYVPEIDVDLVGNTGVPLPSGAAQHLFITTSYGIGDMIIADASASVLTCARAFTVRSG